tara:strand:- start:55 stop:261 length:207 start_codon:yes stop_codon:yes gene_type:complete
MKVNESISVQQTNWQKIANDKQQQLEAAAKGQALKKIQEEQQFEIYKAKGKKLEIESVSLFKRMNIEV